MAQKIRRQVPYTDQTIQTHFIDLLRAIYLLTGEYPNVVETEDGAYRFVEVPIIRWLISPTDGSNDNPHSSSYDPKRPHRVSLNDMAIAYQNGEFSLKEYVTFYMGLGYSLGGFSEVFGEALYSTFEESLRLFDNEESAKCPPASIQGPN